MKIDWLDYDSKDHVLAWFLLEAMAKAGIERFGQFDSSELEVELTVNGISVPITEVMDFLQTQLDHIHEEGRQEGRQEGLHEAIQRVRRRLDDILSAED